MLQRVKFENLKSNLLYMILRNFAIENRDRP